MIQLVDPKIGTYTCSASMAMAVEAAAVAPPMFVCVGGGDLQPPVNSISGPGGSRNSGTGGHGVGKLHETLGEASPKVSTSFDIPLLPKELSLSWSSILNRSTLP